MHRVFSSFSRLLRSNPQTCFSLISIFLLVSIALHPRSSEPSALGFGFPTASAEAIGLAEPRERLVHDGLPTEISVFQDESPERRPEGFNDPIQVNINHLDRRQDQAKVILNNVPVPQGIYPKQVFRYKFQNRASPSDLADRENSANSDGQVSIRETSEHDNDQPLGSNELDLNKRQGENGRGKPVYITISACSQPTFHEKSDRNNPPQLTLYVSSTNSIPNPGPDNANSDNVIVQSLDQGYAIVTLNTTSAIYISVHSPNVKVEDNTFWSYKLAASVDEPYHTFVNSSLNLFMIDSDQSAALLITKNLSSGTPTGQSTDKWLSDGPPLSIFVQEKNNTLINGLHKSYCGLKDTATFPGPYSLATFGIETGLTEYGESSLEQQFYIPNLNATTRYYGILSRPTALDENTPGGGGGVYAAMTFHTKQLANCAVLYNLTFCSSVAYAVPANPAKYSNLTALRKVYDEDAAEKYRNFNYSIQQIPCNTTATAQYSLNKTCSDCARAYKKWLCAVSIPRCADWVPNPSAHLDTSFLQIRNAAQQPIDATPEIKPVTNHTLLRRIATNSSRNNYTIAGRIQPGPYAEILPCVDLCYDLVRSCPASFGFGCPSPGRGLEQSYGRKDPFVNGGVTCSEPGAVFGLSSVGQIHLPWRLLELCVAGAVLLLSI